MARSALALAALLLACPALARGEDLVLRDVQVVDVEAGRVLAGQALVIREGRIAQVVPLAQLALPEGARVIEGRGLFALPGLFDAHVHLSASPETYGPLLIAHGVTCVRDLGGATDEVLALRARHRTSPEPLPRIVCTGAILDGDPPVWPFSEPCGTPEAGRAAVEKLVAAGVDQIKVYSLLQPEVYRAIVETAHAAGKKVTGHVPSAVPLGDALAAGQDCVEHLTGFAAELARLAGRPAEPDPMREPGWEALDALPPEALRELCARVAARKQVQCPTLAVYRGFSRLLVGADPAADPDARSVPPFLLERWREPGEVGAHLARHLQAGLPRAQRLVGALHAAGVPIVAGTDLANPYVFAGASLHDELALLQEAGLSPVAALRAATLEPARLCGLEAELGTIAAGKVASLLLVRRDPLVDARRAREVEGVLVEGRWLDRAALDGLLETATRRAHAAEGQGPVTLSLPGEVVRRGRYTVRFQQGGAGKPQDAGQEEFLLARTDQGWALQAHVQPRGRPQPPTLCTVHYDRAFGFQRATWKQLSDPPLLASYELQDGVLRVSARRGEQELAGQELALPEGALVVPPCTAATLVGQVIGALAPGETKQLKLVSWGFAGHLATISDYSLTRAEDAALEGQPAPARHYRATLATPFGRLAAESWGQGPENLVQRTVMQLPFGQLTTSLEPE